MQRFVPVITGACSVVGSTVVGMIWPTIEPALGYSLLGICGVGYVAAAWLWWRTRHAAPNNSIEQHFDPQSKWLPLHSALHYLVYDSAWAFGHPGVANEKDFDALISSELRERLARGEISARGKAGSGDDALSRTTEPIPAEFWIAAYFQPAGEIWQADDHRGIALIPNTKRSYRAVIVEREAVERAWPARAATSGELSALASVVEPMRQQFLADQSRRDAIEDRAYSKSPIPFEHVRNAIKSDMIERDRGKALSFPYRKAVLRVKEVAATAERAAGAEGLTKIGCHIDIENHAGKSLEGCQIRLVSINGEEPTAPSYLRIGRLQGEATETAFPVLKGGGKRINFMKRDLEDVISNPPFLICLGDRDMPIRDGVEHIAVLALESEYEHPTYAKLRIFTPARDKIELSLEGQSLDLPI